MLPVKDILPIFVNHVSLTQLLQQNALNFAGISIVFVASAFLKSAPNGERPVTQIAFRRLTLALALGISTIAASSFAHAQTTTPTHTTNDGITGTDPSPRGCGCAVPPSTNSTNPGVTSGTAAQTLLVLLGLA